MKETTFDSLKGKVITNAEQYCKTGYDDEGFLLITCKHLAFIQGQLGIKTKHYLIISTYGGYTGRSEDEYCTQISIYEVDISDMIHYEKIEQTD